MRRGLASGVAIGLGLTMAACSSGESGGPDSTEASVTTEVISPTLPGNATTAVDAGEPCMVEPPQGETQIGLAIGDKFFGIDDEAELQAQLDAVCYLGATVIRLDGDMAMLAPEPMPAPLDDGGFNRIVDEAALRGIETQAIIMSTPEFMRAQGCPNEAEEEQYVGCVPTDFIEYSAYAAEFAQSHPEITKFEIWNEPNLELFWHNPDPLQYAELYRAVAAEIRTVRPDALLSLGGMAPKTNDSEYDPIEFIDAVLTALGPDAPKLVDAVSLHPYANYLDGVLPNDAVPGNPLEAIAGDADGGYPLSLREVLDKHSLGGAEIWLGEMGASTYREGEGETEEALDVQRAVIEQYLGRDLTKEGVTMKLVYNFRDPVDRENIEDPEAYFGLLNHRGEKKPAAEAFRRHALAQ